MQFLAQRVVADGTANGCRDVDQQQGEAGVDDAGAGDIAQRAKPRVEGNPVEEKMQNAKRQERQKFERSQQHAEYDEHDLPLAQG